MRRFQISLLSCALAGCGRGASDSSNGIIAIDGSSTVFPISEAVAEEYKTTGATRVTVAMSGTGGGFKKFCNGEIAVTGSSRPIKAEEVELCRARKVEYHELPIALDGITVVVNPAADWVDHMTVAELATLWSPQAQGKVMKWSDVRPGWPAEEIHLFGAGVDSGTYDYFTHAIVGTEHASRGDYTSSEDDNVLVQGIIADRNALGFFGYAYYAENRDKLKLVAIDDGVPDNGDGAISPSPESVADGTYQPLSRPLFLYVSSEAATRPEVSAFVEFYLTRGPGLVREVGYIPLPDVAYGLVRDRFAARKKGSLFGGKGSRVGTRTEQILRAG